MVKATQEQLKSIQQEATTKNFIFPHLGVFNIAANWGHNIKNIKYEMSKKISKYIAHWAIFTFSINNNLNITIFSGPTNTYYFIEKSCLLTDRIKKSSINTAPNGRMPAIRLLKG